MSFICLTISNHFHVNGFALSLALKQRLEATRKWPIRYCLRVLALLIGEIIFPSRQADQTELLPMAGLFKEG